MTYYKLSDIRERLEQVLNKPISRSLAAYYTNRYDFPKSKIKTPIRLWEKRAIDKWLKQWERNKND